jgi:thiol:disulfide interchange protein DsbC
MEAICRIKKMDPLTFLFSFSLVFLGFLIGTWGVFPLSTWAQCPPTERIQQDIKKIFPKLQFELVKITPSEVHGLCQIQLKIGKKSYLLYSNSTGEFLISGNIFEVKSGKNLTQETVVQLNRLSTEEMRHLESLTAFTLGQGEKIVYVATDPQCSYCRQAESILKDLVAKENIQIRFLFFPLPSHKGAREQCISILCDNKGLQGYDSGYRSDNQCPAGIKKVDETIDFLRKMGINSTPTFIFSNGVVLSGVLSEEELRWRLGISKNNPPARPK